MDLELDVDGLGSFFFGGVRSSGLGDPSGLAGSSIDMSCHSCIVVSLRNLYKRTWSWHTVSVFQYPIKEVLTTRSRFDF